VESPRAEVAVQSTSGFAASSEKIRSRQYASAIQAYEAAIKLMHAEQFRKAIRCFEDLVAEHVEEPEIQERAKVLIHACEKKIQEKERTVLRSADDHYNVGIADLNRRELTSAIGHLEHALKLAPKADHVLYALATANALQGSRDQALQFLRQAIQYRPENRFLAARDSDFESLHEDAEFRELVRPTEK
jgi:tetratricopeptide (TPR) repeat protein